MFKKVDSRLKIQEMEASVLNYWDKNKIFEKSVQEKPKEKAFSFYDGPPFATGTPHYGHILAGTIKDVIPRFKTMQGFRVERVWGWDTHGLPIENIVEQELDFKSKTQVEEYGVDKFNEKCRSKVLKYADEWQKIVGKTGRWVDMENAYLSMDPKYMESVWWVFKSLWDKDLIYPGHKVMPYCPRCATGLSNFEVGQAYKDKRDKAATIKFESADEPGTYFLAWTTTPWTLPGNLALAVGPKIDYVKVEKDGTKYILAKERLEHYKDELGGAKVLETFKGKDLEGKKYKPVFDYYENSVALRNAQGTTTSKAVGQAAFEVVGGEHVTIEDGTGIVHTAPAFGEEDYQVSKKAGIDFFMPVNDLGEFTIEVPEYAGQSVVTLETNENILKDLGNTVFKVEEISHSYPHCWRCDTPLIYKAIDSYYVAVEKIKDQVAENNKKIKWMPSAVGKGRFAKLIEGAPDWSISRNRFWGTPLPVWVCDDCGKVQVFGGREELAKASGQQIDDMHLHFMEKVEVPCTCGGKAHLLGDVLDCWFESGSMPYASIHYPFENEEKFKRDFPADFIAEGIDQTRGWFYSLLVLATGLVGKSSYENVVVNGIVLAEDGQKMSKKLKNYPDPMVLMGRHGADAMRFYMMSSPAVRAGDLAFSEKGVDEVVKSVILRLWNSYSFFATYAALDGFNPTGNLDSSNILDKWLLSVTNRLIDEVTKALEGYDIAKGAKLLWEYIDQLSNWYIRRSRKRFWKSENDTDKNAAYETLYFALDAYNKLLAPFMPFVTDEIYQGLNGTKESVHLDEWPVADPKAISDELEEQMAKTRQVIELGLSKRNEEGIKVRQPLNELTVSVDLPDDLLYIAAEEVNVKEVTVKEKKGMLSVELDTKITQELKNEGIARDFVRSLQEGRKKAGFNVEDRIVTAWETTDMEVAAAIKSQSDYVAKETLSVEFTEGKKEAEYEDTVKLNGGEVWFGISRREK